MKRWIAIFACLFSGACWGTILAVGAHALVGCVMPTKGVTLPPLPAWRAPADPTPISGLMVRLQAQSRYPAARIQAADSSYTRVSREWLDAYTSWTWEAARAAGVAYTPESFDCDDFSLGFYFFATRAAAKAGVRAAPLVARIVVEWDAGTRHELVAVVTDAGIVAVEPQPDAGPFRITPLDKFERQVLAITFGDATP